MPRQLMPRIPISTVSGASHCVLVHGAFSLLPSALQGSCSAIFEMHYIKPKSVVQMVDRMDTGEIPSQVVAASYEALWKLVSKALYRTHVEGKLKVGVALSIPGCGLFITLQC